MEPVELLAGTPLFDDLTQEDVKDLAEHLKRHDYRSGDVIFRQGEAGDSMFVVMDGTVLIYLQGDDHDKVPLRELTVGHHFGELALFDDKARSASAEAMGDCVLLELERETLKEHIKRRPRIAFAILGELAERLRETNALLSQRAAKNVNKELDEKATLGDRVADRVATVAGSWAFILSFIGVLLTWITVNGVAMSKALMNQTPFDPFPFVFFNLLLSIVAAFQGPVIMMSQNRQGLKDRAQAETDFKVNLKNEIGIESLQRGVAELKAQIAVLEKSQTKRDRSIVPPPTG